MAYVDPTPVAMRKLAYMAGFLDAARDGFREPSTLPTVPLYPAPRVVFGFDTSVTSVLLESATQYLSPGSGFDAGQVELSPSNRGVLLRILGPSGGLSTCLVICMVESRGFANELAMSFQDNSQLARWQVACVLGDSDEASVTAAELREQFNEPLIFEGRQLRDQLSDALDVTSFRGLVLLDAQLNRVLTDEQIGGDLEAAAGAAAARARLRCVSRAFRAA